MCVTSFFGLGAVQKSEINICFFFLVALPRRRHTRIRIRTLYWRAPAQEFGVQRLMYRPAAPRFWVAVAGKRGLTILKAYNNHRFEDLRSRRCILPRDVRTEEVLAN